MNQNIDGTISHQQQMPNNTPTIDDRLSTKLNHLVQKAVDEAIEQHRIKGESIAISENGRVKIVPPEEITPLADKLKQRETNQQQIH